MARHPRWPRFTCAIHMYSSVRGIRTRNERPPTTYCSAVRGMLPVWRGRKHRCRDHRHGRCPSNTVDGMGRGNVPRALHFAILTILNHASDLSSEAARCTLRNGKQLVGPCNSCLSSCSACRTQRLSLQSRFWARQTRRGAIPAAL